jgi:hypothetical protein
LRNAVGTLISGPHVQQLLSTNKWTSRVKPSTSESGMPEQKTLQRAEQNKREDKASAARAAEFICEEMDHVHDGSGFGSGGSRLCGAWRSQRIPEHF